MPTELTGGGSTTSFTNTPQAKDDSYSYIEDWLRNSSLYSISSKTVTLDVMSNDLGGNAKSLFSIDDGNGNTLAPDFELLCKDVNAAGCSPWEKTPDGNWIRLNNGKIEFKIGNPAAPDDHTQALDLNSLAGGQCIDDEFVYAIRLGNGTLSQATVRIHITGENDVATIGVDGNVADDRSVSELGVNPGNTAFPGDPTASGKLAIVDPDAGEDHFQAPPAAALIGTYGTFTFDNMTGAWSYTLNNGLTATQSLKQGQVVTETLIVTSADGGTSYPITITITGTNDLPIAVADIATATEDGAIVTGSVATNDSDVDQGAALTFSVASPPDGFTMNADGSWTFDPSNLAYQHIAQGATAEVTVNYTVTDEFGASATSTLTLTVTGTNDGPVAVADTGSAGENENKAFDVVANDTDVDDGAMLSLFSIDGVTVGGNPASAAELAAFSMVGGKVQFTPGTAFDHLAQGASATVVVSYTVKDQHGAPSTSTLTLTVTGTNDGPVATDDTGAGNEDSTITGSVATNDNDVDDGATLTYAVNGASPAGFSMNSAGNWTLDASNLAYQHLATGATTVVIVGYTVSDGLGGSDIGELKVTVTGVNDDPALTGTQATLAAGTEDQNYLVSKVSLLAGFSDIDDGAVLGIMGLTANHGSVIDNGNGTYTIVPDANYNGVVVLSYSVVDGVGGSVPATINFSLAAVNDPAVIGGPITGTVVEATPSDAGTPTATGTLTAADVDNPPNTFIAQGSTATATGYGSYTMSAAGVWTYTLNNANATVNALATGMFLIDTFTVQSADGTTQTITITIDGATDAIVVTPPAPFTGTGDPNDFDGLSGGAVVSGNFTATNGNDTFTGDGGDQTLNGQGGNDTIYGAGGNDNINGNNDNDTLYGQAGNDNVSGNNGLDTLYGGSGDDTLTGGNDGDTIYGGSGVDIIDGSGGNDIIIGGYGADTLTGGNNDDTFVYLDLKDTNDTILDFMDAGNDQIDLSALDANSATGLNEVFGWGGNTPTANSLWFSESGGNTTLYGDTDGNVSTAEFMVLLPGFNGFNAFTNPLTPPPDITF
jgi:VCBS repeat-containing protein